MEIKNFLKVVPKNTKPYYHPNVCFEELKLVFERQFKQSTSREWQWDKYSKVYFRKICKYLNNEWDDKPAEFKDFSIPAWQPNKSIIFMGKNGCGKTTLLKFLRYAAANPTFGGSKVKYRECEDVRLDVQECNGDYQAYLKDVIYAFDELGREGILNYYGNKMEVMDTILCGRVNRGYKTFVSTNWNNQMILDRYGSTLHSRIFGEYNAAVWGDDAIDYRMK